MPDAATCETALRTILPNLPAAKLTAMGILFAATHATDAARANETSGAGLFRGGKAVYQLGVGYSVETGAGTEADPTVPATLTEAIASTNWKNIA